MNARDGWRFQRTIILLCILSLAAAGCQICQPGNPEYIEAIYYNENQNPDQNGQTTFSYLQFYPYGTFTFVGITPQGDTPNTVVDVYEQIAVSWLVPNAVPDHTGNYTILGNRIYLNYPVTGLTPAWQSLGIYAPDRILAPDQSGTTWEYLLYPPATGTAAFVRIGDTPVGLGDAAITSPLLPTTTTTPLPGAVFKPDMNAYCRSGPDPIFDSIALAMNGHTYPIDGRNQENTYYLLRLTDQVECWVLQNAGEASGDLLKLRVMLPIPTPTFTPLPDQRFDCAKYDDNYKSCFAHSDACTWQGPTGGPTGKCVNK